MDFIILVAIILITVDFIFASGKNVFNSLLLKEYQYKWFKFSMALLYIIVYFGLYYILFS